MQVTLEVTAEGMAKRAFTFEEPGGFTFGRARDCTCQTKTDKTFSRHHFLLEIRPPRVILKDLGSLNGTYVNGHKHGGREPNMAPEDVTPMAPWDIQSGDRIRAGRYEILVLVEDEPVCVDCGKAIPTEQRDACRFVGNSFLCAECRTRSSEKATREGAAAAEDSMSVEQRQEAEDNPSAVVDAILGRFLGSEDAEKPPFIQGYTDIRRVAEGGFGVVYSALRESDNCRVALKTMLQTRKPPKRQVLMFEREKEIALQLRHPSIVRCYRAGQWADIHYIEMEYVEGITLADLIDQHGQLSLNDSKSIMLQVLEGLAHAHKAEITVDVGTGPHTVSGVVHRDLKPPNILLGGEPGDWVVKITDFGLAKTFAEAGMTQGSVTVTGGFAGTLGYMAPEHVTNYRYVKPATDVFEVMATFYHMLTGRYVWRFRKGVEPVRTILEDSIDPIAAVLHEIPPAVALVFDRALAREIDERHEDASALLNEMRAALRDTIY